ncbi:MAG: hypothetical protein ACRDNW_11800, partial [Trebonia sp.]
MRVAGGLSTRLFLLSVVVSPSLHKRKSGNRPGCEACRQVFLRPLPAPGPRGYRRRRSAVTVSVTAVSAAATVTSAESVPM